MLLFINENGYQNRSQYTFEFTLIQLDILKRRDFRIESVESCEDGGFLEVKSIDELEVDSRSYFKDLTKICDFLELRNSAQN